MLFMTSSSSAPKYPDDGVSEAVGGGVLSVNQSIDLISLAWVYEAKSKAAIAMMLEYFILKFIKIATIITHKI